jgi:hypothetical protein
MSRFNVTYEFFFSLGIAQLGKKMVTSPDEMCHIHHILRILYLNFVSIIIDVFFLLYGYVQTSKYIREFYLWYGDGLLHCIYYHCVSFSRMLFWNFYASISRCRRYRKPLLYHMFRKKNPKSAGAPLALINNWRRRRIRFLGIDSWTPKTFTKLGSAPTCCALF